MDTVADRNATPALNAHIAARVRSGRARLGLSLDGLASKSGVSRSMISLIEREQCSPTAVVLERIATGLDTPLASLFDAAVEETAVPVSRRADRISWRDPRSGYVRRNISPAGVDSVLQIVDVVLPAGARVAYETCTRNISIHQQIWVQQGRVDVTVGRTIHRLSEDDCLAMQLNEPTTFHNRADVRPDM